MTTPTHAPSVQAALAAASSIRSGGTPTAQAMRLARRSERGRQIVLSARIATGLAVTR